jgi:hypothetical protein
MYGVCTSCPGAETLKVLIQNELDGMTIEYKQWVVTDRATLMTLRQQSEEIIENLVSKKPDLNHHHYTANNRPDI